MLRLVAGSALIARSFGSIRVGPVEPATLAAIATAAGLLLLAGLWTPAAGAVAGVLGVWNAIIKPGDPWTDILLAAMGAGLAFLGPGAWSLDARLFGWKRIDVSQRRN